MRHARILQKLSPQLDSNKPQHIPLAKAGDILITDSELLTSNVGYLSLAAELVLQDITIDDRYVEWEPLSMGGKMFKNHGANPPAMHPGNRHGRQITAQGNEVSHYRSVSGNGYTLQLTETHWEEISKRTELQPGKTYRFTVVECRYRDISWFRFRAEIANA